MRSIERYLLAWTVGALTFGLLLVAIVSYLLTLDEMNEVFDAELQSIAGAVAAYHHAGHETNVPAEHPASPVTPMPNDTGIVVRIWTLEGEPVFGSDSTVALPFTRKPGPSAPRINNGQWAAWTIVNEDGVIQAAQPEHIRHGLAIESATKILLPMFALLVLVSTLVVFVLRRGLRPVDNAASDIAARSERTLDPIPTDAVPRELSPLVVAINGLMARLADALMAQRRFLADAAHELRTPVTALRLQLQLLERAPDDAARGLATTDLKAGIDRTQRLIEQLLQVARSGADGEHFRAESVDLLDLARSAVATMSTKAAHRRIDLGLRESQTNAHGAKGRMVVGDRGQLTVLLNNLVENALRYTPPGGTVDVDASPIGGDPALRVIDDGPGIDVAERERVFARFYRGTHDDESGDRSGGSGLGLAIVRAIADRHHAVVSLVTPPAGHGLEVQVSFPTGVSAR